MKIRHTPPSKTLVEQSIPTTCSVDTKKQTVSFSFSDFKCQSVKNDKFCNHFKHITDYGRFISLFLSKLSSFSSMTVQELREGNKSTRCHPVQGENLKLLKEILLYIGLPKEKIEQIEEFYQITVATSSGRVMGYFVGSIYYVVLIDPHHLLYPDMKKSVNQDMCNTYDPWVELLQ